MRRPRPLDRLAERRAACRRLPPRGDSRRPRRLACAPFVTLAAAAAFSAVLVAELRPALAFTPADGLTLCDRAGPPIAGRPSEEPLAAPISIAWEEADFASARAVCPSTGAWLRPHLSALIATADFYGTLGAGAMIGARWALPSGIELQAAMDVFMFRFVQNASIARTALGTGHATLGALFGNLGFERHGFRFAPAVRLLVPSSTFYRTAFLLGVDPALVFGGRPLRRIEVFGSLGYALWTPLSAGGINAWHGPTLALGAAVTVFSRVKMLIQLDASGRARDDFHFERIALSFAARLRIGKAFRLELAAGHVFSRGLDRTDVVAGLNLSLMDR